MCACRAAITWVLIFGKTRIGQKQLLMIYNIPNTSFNSTIETFYHPESSLQFLRFE